MTYKNRLRLTSSWVFESPGHEPLALGEVLRLLAGIQAAGHLAGACRACGLSYRHAWGILRKAEAVLGQSLLHTSRRQGSTLTEFARQLLQLEEQADGQLAPLAAEIEKQASAAIGRFYTPSPERLRLHASHGFAVEGLTQMAADGGRPPIELRYRTATEALSALSRDECDMAGFQVPDGHHQQAALQHYLPLLDQERHALVYLATRATGMFVPKDNPKNIRSVADLARPDVRFVNRQPGSGTRLLLSLLLDEAGIDRRKIRGYDSSEFTHMAIAAHVVSGMADVGIGVETAAWRCGLGFIPLARERYFFAVQRDKLDTPSMQALFGLLSGETYQAFLSQLVGYDTRRAGEVLSLTEAFGAASTASPASAGPGALAGKGLKPVLVSQDTAGAGL